ncbi:MAG: DNA polymerase/3'-5' exonuclease PolX [Desulfobacterales bacterium]
MKNREIAKKLNEIADILEFNEVEWKPRAYRSAARKIENMSQEVEDIYKEKGKKGLEEISSVGKRLAEHIADYIEKGEVKRWQELEKKGKKGSYELVKLEGLGPNKARQLYKELDIKTVADLKKAVKNKKIRELEGFGKKSEDNIQKAILQFEKGHERMLIGKAWKIAWELIDYIKENATIKKIDYAGSLRRMKETIGDIDLLAISDNPGKVMEIFVEAPDVKRVIQKGKTKTTVLLDEGIHVDLRVIEQGSYGSALQYFTGSKDHNIAVRNIALDKGYKLSEYGLFRKKNGEKVSGENEEDIYDKIGLIWMPPELRQNRGEIEASKNNDLPKLVELADIKGDLQMHTKYSDGHDTIENMAKKAKELGYDYIAITDHSQSETIAKGLSEKQLRKAWNEIGKIAKKEKIKILKSAEVNVLADGNLDYSDDLLKDMDVVLMSVHSRFKSSKKEMTERLLRALDNKYVNILAHPTGRMIHKREGYDADFEKIFKKCAENEIALEINADPQRLDLNDIMILKAKKHHVKFCINTDAHSSGGLENMRFGVGQARRGWLEKKDVINTYTNEKLLDFFKKSG